MFFTRPALIRNLRHKNASMADVCLIAEGCYPYVAGGVSTWIDWLIRSQPDLTFRVSAILASEPEGPERYKRPANLIAIDHLQLDADHLGQVRAWPQIEPAVMAARLGGILNDGNAADMDALVGLLGPDGRKTMLETLLNSNQAWETLCTYYASMPHADFASFFWAWRALAGGLFRILTAPLPEARAYHAVSTGYAGLLGARAAIETGRPFMLTEHGIYSNERRIEILMADWISNSVDNGLDFSDVRRDIRELWARSFESFARIAYHYASDVVALYEANGQLQQSLGASPKKLCVIPNGIDVERFAGVRPKLDGRPTVAFIGRVTPIKDVMTFIAAADQLRGRIEGLRMLVMGPMDEDPDYARSCIEEVNRRGLEHTVEFTGPVNVLEHLGKVDLVVLTSISEALPLVLLEAGGAGVACVATDVGACRDILEGKGDEFGPGGIVAPVGGSEAVAEAIATLLENPEMRRAYSGALRRRVQSRYRAQTVGETYASLYARNLGFAGEEAR